MSKRRRLTMRQLRHLLRLRSDGVSVRDIADLLGIARSTVQDGIGRAATAGLSWPLPADLTDDVLEGKLFARQGTKQGLRRLPEPDWSVVAVELKKPGVTLTILWEEYRAVHPDGYGFSRFCDLFRGFERRLTPTMRQVHIAGDKVFVVYPARSCLSSIARPARSARRRSLSACSAHQAMPLQKPPGPRPCRTGSARTYACSPSSAACRA